VTVPGVARVDALTGEYLILNHKIVAAPPISLAKRFAPPPGHSGTYLSVVPDVEPLSSQGETLVKDLRSVPAPFHVLVAGTSAQLVDTNKVVLGRLPWALGMIALATFVLLFVMTGSLLVPMKALVLNTLTATFGATVWIFQEAISHTCGTSRQQVASTFSHQS